MAVVGVVLAVLGLATAGVGATGSTGVARPALDAVSGGAAAVEQATRGTAVQVIPTLPPPVDPACQLPAGVPSDAGQVVVAHANGTYASVDLLEQIGGVWTCARRGMPGRVGRSGIRPLAQRVSGDGTTPAGVFPLATMTAPDGQVFEFFGNGTNPGVHGGWRQVQYGDCWDASGGDATYNTLTYRSPAYCGANDEYLPYAPGAYSRAALIGANMGPDRSGDQPGEVPRAAAIFLHRFSYDSWGNSLATSGCVSLGPTDLDAVLRALAPGQAWFVIGS